MAETVTICTDTFYYPVDETVRCLNSNQVTLVELNAMIQAADPAPSFTTAEYFQISYAVLGVFVVLFGIRTIKDVLNRQY